MTSFRRDDEKGGILKCYIPSTDSQTSPTDLGDDIMLVPVVYTSPYSFHSDGGIIAIPPDGTDILVQKIGGTYYYLTSIVGEDPAIFDEYTSDTVDEKLNKFSIDRSYEPIYDKTTEQPNTITIRHPRGHRLVLKDEIPIDGEVNNSKAELRSSKGKVVSLDDSAAVDSLKLGVWNGQGKDIFDGITIAQGTNGAVGARCIRTETEGNITTISHSGNVKTIVSDGNNIELRNESTGFNANQLSPTGPNFGNISQGSQYGDINIVAGSTPEPLGPSKIVIEQKGLGGAIRVAADGSVEIDALNITIRSIGDLNLESLTGSIKLSAPLGTITNTASLGINLQAIPTGNVSMTAPAGKIIAHDLTYNPLVPTFIPIVPPYPVIPYIPSVILPTVALRGYIPFGWLI